MKHPITIRIDVDLLGAARQRAHVENRTLTNFVETILKNHIAGVSPAADEPAASFMARSGPNRITKRKPVHG